MARDLLPEDAKTTGRVQIQGFDGKADRFDTAIVTMEIGEHRFPIRVALMERDRLKRSAILGQNLVTPTIKELLPDRPPQDLTELQPLQLVNAVLTRAASKRAAAQQEEDHLATLASEAEITDLDQVVKLPEPPADDALSQQRKSCPRERVRLCQLTQMRLRARSYNPRRTFRWGDPSF